MHNWGKRKQSRWISDLGVAIYSVSLPLLLMLCCIFSVFVLHYLTACMDGLPQCKATIRWWVGMQMLATIPPFLCLGLIFHYWSNKRPQRVVWLGQFLGISLLGVSKSLVVQSQ